MLTKKQIKKDRDALRKIREAVYIKSLCCNIGSDPTRLKILYLLKKYKKLCVSDIAKVLDVSVSAISHQLTLLERARLVSKNKIGKLVCYSLEKSAKEIYCLLRLVR